jgi:excinuclease ABC subunit A
VNGCRARRDERAGHARIEHTRKREVIKTADWIIDLGPEGGDKGGEIVAEGTPEDVAGEPRSYTGQYLAPLLKGTRAEVVAAPAKKRRGSSASMRERQAAE